MVDDANRLDVDRRLREILAPPGAVVDRVVAAAALARQQSRTPVGRWRWAAITAVALLIVAVVAWRRGVPRESTVAVTTVGRAASMLVVHSSDGRRWLFSDPAAPRSDGHYVIVVPASEVTR